MLSTTGILKSDGGTAVLGPDALQAIRASVRCATCLPGEPGYEEARTIWNAMIDRRPAMIIRAAGASDVIAAVNLAREHGLVFAIRSGGHNIAGTAVCDGGLMLDLSLMKSVRVDPAAKRVRVEPGAVLGDVDRETQAFGLALPVGINSTTGIAGLTLGGGFGWLSRKYGLTIDNLLSVDVVTADGRLVRASSNENPDLFWAVRGGGGNFGVVTSFEFRLHPVGPQVLAGLVVHPLSEGRSLLAQYRQIAADAPEELACWVVLRKAPPLPFLPSEVHGTHVLVFAMCYAGDLKEGQRAVAPILSLGRPVGTHVGPMPLTAWQTAFDPLLTPGARNYWKSHDFTSLSDETIAILVDYAGRVPTPQCEVFIAQLGGAVNSVPTEATAYPHRQIAFVVNVHTRWDDATQDHECIAWTRAFFDAAAPHATGGVYVNFMPDDEAGRVHRGAYGPNYDKLAALKRKYDPTNLFRLNQNISPEKAP
jgi:FAD/FMN-containing dehydrogenase